MVMGHLYMNLRHRPVGFLQDSVSVSCRSMQDEGLPATSLRPSSFDLRLISIDLYTAHPSDGSILGHSMLVQWSG